MKRVRAFWILCVLVCGMLSQVTVQATRSLVDFSISNETRLANQQHFFIDHAWQSYLKPFDPIQNPVITKDMVTDRQATGVADPFIVYEDGGYHLFFEVLSTQGEEIGHAQSTDLVHWHYTGIVLDNRVHRSAYPNIFKYDQHWYLIPDSAKDGDVRLYEATHFPDQWRFKTTLLNTQSSPNKTIVDTNVFYYQGNWYMTTTHGKDVKEAGMTLYVNTSGDFRNNQWHRHPADVIIPVDSEYRGIRGAGNPFVFDDAVYLPVQTTPRQSNIYGERTFLYRLTNLTPTTVDVENQGFLIGAQHNQSWNSRAMHHCSHAPYRDGYVYAVDGMNDQKEYSIGLYVNAE